MVLIQNWLDGKQNFIVGRALYNQYGNNADLKVLFAKGETSTAKAALQQALLNLVNKDLHKQVAHLVAPAPAAEQDPAPLMPEPVPGKQEFSRMPESEDPILKALQLNWKDKYKQMQYLRAQLDNYGTDNSPETQATCNEICRQILFS